MGVNLDVMDTIYTEQAIESQTEQAVQILETMFENNQFDLVAIGRSMMADPDWVTKIKDRRFNDVVPFRREIVKQALQDWDDSAIRRSSVE